jgi:hypothetical protein
MNSTQTSQLALKGEDTGQETKSIQEKTKSRQLTYPSIVADSTSLSQPAPKLEAIQQETNTSNQPPVPPSLHFRPNVDLSSKGNTQPEELHIDVHTTSSSEKFRLNEVVSMTVELAAQSQTSDEVNTRALYFLTSLSGVHLENMKVLTISGFLTDMALWMLFSRLFIEELRLTCSLPLLFPSLFLDLSQLRRLYLKLEENSDLRRLPYLPPSLEELSLHFSNLTSQEDVLDLSACKRLGKM